MNFIKKIFKKILHFYLSSICSLEYDRNKKRSSTSRILLIFQITLMIFYLGLSLLNIFRNDPSELLLFTTFVLAFNGWLKRLILAEKAMEKIYVKIERHEMTVHSSNKWIIPISVTSSTILICLTMVCLIYAISKNFDIDFSRWFVKIPLIAQTCFSSIININDCLMSYFEGTPKIYQAMNAEDVYDVN